MYLIEHILVNVVISPPIHLCIRFFFCSLVFFMFTALKRQPYVQPFCPFSFLFIQNEGQEEGCRIGLYKRILNTSRLPEISAHPTRIVARM